ncbi:undecaprenyl-phosphate glucose phosphotransferase [Paraflavisolibacter sp. H34]|uniref:undecaprenyl-phosphate glucose phosphotransferase n=1 Tax=Huijunlia imazamoxiresistens TaxID=3127457 RepID=UPI00301B40E1
MNFLILIYSFMNNRLMRLSQFGALVLDLAALNVLFLLLQYQMQRIEDVLYLQYTYFLMFLSVSWIAVSYASYLYHFRNLLHYEGFCRCTMRVYFFWLMIVFLYLFFTRQFDLSRLFIIYFLTGYGCLLVINRFLYLGWRRALQQNTRIARRVVIIGYNPTAKKLAAYLEAEGQYTEVVGFCEDEENIKELTHYPVLSSKRQAMETSLKHGVHEVYSTIAPEKDEEIYRLMEEAEVSCIRFRIIPDLQSVVNRNFQVAYLNDIPILSMRNPHIDDPGNIIRKRFFDVAVSGIVILTILSWLVPLLALLIKLESRGPVFFRQQRTGKNNLPFWCLKFRSMKVNKDANSRQATRNDARLTRVGKFLRKSSLDEFPQFINVFRGDMSIVGPRPHMLQHTNDYSKVINDYMVRQFLKPGVTGWAQVNGYRGETRQLKQMQKRVEHDLWYMENWSLWLDVKIIFLTVFSVFTGDKNAF